jgi:hypothetical protein
MQPICELAAEWHRIMERAGHGERIPRRIITAIEDALDSLWEQRRHRLAARDKRRPDLLPILDKKEKLAPAHV